MLELSIFTKYVLPSAENATRFGQDRLIDESEIIIALQKLERHRAPEADTPLPDDLLAQFEALKVSEGVTANLICSREGLSGSCGYRM